MVVANVISLKYLYPVSCCFRESTIFSHIPLVHAGGRTIEQSALVHIKSRYLAIQVGAVIGQLPVVVVVLLPLLLYITSVVHDTVMSWPKKGHPRIVRDAS